MSIYTRLTHELIIVFCLLQLLGLIYSIDDFFDPTESFYNHDNHTSIKKVFSYHPANDLDNDNLMVEMLTEANEGMIGRESLRRDNQHNQELNLLNNKNDQVIEFNFSTIDLINITDYDFHFNNIISSLSICWEELSVEKRQQLRTSFEAYVASGQLFDHDFRIVTTSLVKIIRRFFTWSLQRLKENCISTPADQCSTPHDYYHHGNYHSLSNFSDYSAELQSILMKVSSYWEETEVAKKQSVINAFNNYINNDTSIFHDIMLANAMFIKTSTLFILYWSWAISVILMMVGTLSLIGAFYVTKMIFKAMKYFISVIMVLLRRLIVICSYIPTYCYVLFAAWITFNYLYD